MVDAMTTARQQLRERAKQLLFRLGMWEAKHTGQKWTFQIRIVLDELVFNTEPALPLMGSPNPAKSEAERARRRELLQRVTKHFQAQADFDEPLADDIQRLLQDYADAPIQ